MTRGIAVPYPPSGTSQALVLLFFIGIYTGVAFKLPGGIPVPAVIAGVAGGLLLAVESSRIKECHLFAIIAVLMLYALSILSASDVRLLGERFKGLVQLTYSLMVGYALFLALTRFHRLQLATVMLGFSMAILIGCALENSDVLKGASDSFRAWAFDSGVYKADLRDKEFYGRIRPKLFTSEPSAVAFMFSLFAFAWYALSDMKWKLMGFLVLIGAGYFVMRGPTLLLCLALVPVYELLLGARRGPPGNSHLSIGRVAATIVLTAVLIGIAVPVVHTLYAARIEAITSGQDPSFFSRIIAPPLVALKVIATYPAAGAGLTGWEFIEDATQQVYGTAPWLSTDYRFDTAAQAITNYFWLHWIYLGLFWGGVLLVALSLMLQSLGVPSVLFCWIVWAFFGQGAGSYVGPQAWTVLFLSAAIAVVVERDRLLRHTRRPAAVPERGDTPGMPMPSPALTRGVR
jgi:hypothetical protein